MVDGGNCPPEVADALICILRKSIMLIRQAGNADDAEWCAEEANHIHNVPNLLRSYSRDRLQNYIDFARGGYAGMFCQHFQGPPTLFVPYWEQLESHLRSTQS